jgi:phage tail-like protein
VAQKSSGSRPDRTPDAVHANRFTLSLDQEDVGSFTEIGGLAVTIDTEEVAEGGQNGYTHRLPRGMKWTNIVLKRGVTDSEVLFAWLAECSGPQLESLESKNFEVPRRTATITVHDGAGKPVKAWSLDGAYPVRWTGPRFAASASELAVEELEVCHRGLYAAG